MAKEARPQTDSGAPSAELLGVLLGNYRVLSKLGAGGMGEVYIGRHEALGHKVAIKVLRSEMTRNTEMVKRFFNEAQAATAIRNPGIVQIFDFGTTPDGSAYFVMELLDGVSLTDRLKERLLDPVESCRLTRQIANVLQAAHDVGITHRDLKPDNLFLVPDSEVIGGERIKVLDFGIAKLTGEIHMSGVMTRADVVMGTPSYMSPEQCRGAGSVDTRSDIYSLGCVLYKMVCGRPPFVGQGPGDILASHMHRPAPDLREFAPDVPPALAALVGKMLEKKRDARPQTMAAVSQALEEILHDLVGPPARPSMMHMPALVPPLAPPLAPPPLAPPTFSHATAPPTVPPPTVPPMDAVPTTMPGVPSAATTLPGASLPSASAAIGMPAWREPGTPVWNDAPSVVGWGGSPMPGAPGAPGVPSTTGTTTLSGSAGVSSAKLPPSPPERRSPLLLGGFVVVVGAVTAVIVALLMKNPDPPAPQSASKEIEVPPPAAKATTPGTEGTPAGPAPGTAAGSGPTTTAEGTTMPGSAATTAPTGAAQTGGAPAGDDLESECRGYQVDKKWKELRNCADELMPLAPKVAAELRRRAEEETKTAPHVAAADAALRDKLLRRARDEIELVWSESVELPRLRGKYAVMEAQVITELVASLEQAKTATCAEYEALLTKERASQPSRVLTEATRRSTCTPVQKCDADALAQKAKDEWTKRRYAASLESYDAALKCQPNATLARKAFGLACEAHAVAKAKVFWKLLPAVSRNEAKVECIRDGISEQQLNAP
ncbi:MAG TPA: serine/threonine-protein kinase [Kofleriaceae bacterium]|nr:serine/threonine-protein kinase [Kofleriaceae bacterium]